LAEELKLFGYVFNDARGVTIEIEGTAEATNEFLRRLQADKPRLAVIRFISVEEIPPLDNSQTFDIHASPEGGERTALVSPDADVCEECQKDVLEANREASELIKRRYHYPFTNCTHCGPRFTIIQNIPYDRKMTTMRAFPMCPDCQREYKDWRDRRFHAQPVACTVCGPHVSLVDGTGQAVDCADPVLETAQLLAAGKIIAIKAIGGYNLACDAFNAEAVQLLRKRKHREGKPFALLVANIEVARQVCEIKDEEAELLQAWRKPIVLLKKRADCDLAPEVAPLYNTLGIMLAYTPLMHIYLEALAHIPGRERPAVLVMTSGNVKDEPIAYKDADARERLFRLADALLENNREIHMRCDDSVTRFAADGEQIFRYSRGYAPEPLEVSFEFPIPLLACGTQSKNTFCMGKKGPIEEGGKQAFISQHIGDLGNKKTRTYFEEAVNHFQFLFGIRPDAVVYDLNPNYYPTRFALKSSIQKKIGVQHHHAHIASVLAEHGLTMPVIGIALDGAGYGTDGALWGCEVMVANLLDFERKAHLAYIPLPGGNTAAHEPWLMAAVYLEKAYNGDTFLDLDIPFVRQLDRHAWRTKSSMIQQKVNSPLTSSMGRLFDAVAALVGLRSKVQYGGQAAIELEMQSEASTVIYPFTLLPTDTPMRLDVIPMIRAIVSDLQQGVSVPQIAGRFHRSVAKMLAETCAQIQMQARVQEQKDLKIVALSGGVFQNRLLLEQLIARLKGMGFEVYINRRIPPNNEGISLGQAAIAAARIQKQMEVEQPI
jgi:hydrogenase maturation protein HypF